MGFHFYKLREGGAMFKYHLIDSNGMLPGFHDFPTLLIPAACLKTQL